MGDPVVRTHQPLSVELGPGVMGNIFDGIQARCSRPASAPVAACSLPPPPQRPLKTIAKVVNGVFIPRGIAVPSLDRDVKWAFTPVPTFKVGDLVTGGDIYGTVPETELIQHRIMVPPNAKGRITFIAPAGNYTIEETTLELELAGEKKKFCMLQKWPVRLPRPVGRKEMA